MGKIEFTKDQYAQLLKLVYLGNWMVNAHRTPDEDVEEYQELESYIFSKAKEFGLAQYVDISPEGIFPTAEFESQEDLHEYIEDYDDQTFWDALIQRLADRKCYSLFTEKEIEAMDDIERLMLFARVEEQYAEEFEKNGLDNLDVRLEQSGAEKIPFDEGN